MFLIVVHTGDVDRTLMEIPADEDPLWLYFDSHYVRIMDALQILWLPPSARRLWKSIVRAFCIRMAVQTNRAADVLQTVGLTGKIEDALRIELQTAMGNLYARRSDALIGMCTAMTFIVTELI